MSEKDNGSGMLYAFVAGGIIGAVFALLYAPASGEETREKIGDWMASTKTKGQRFFDDKKEFVTSTKDALNAAYEAGKKAYNEKTGNNQSA
jgi:gas vesicle protein